MIELAELRRSVGVTQVQLAKTLATTQAQISRLERQQDMLLSTLTAYLAGLGLHSKILIEVGEQRLTYELTTGKQ